MSYAVKDFWLSKTNHHSWEQSRGLWHTEGWLHLKFSNHFKVSRMILFVRCKVYLMSFFLQLSKARTKNENKSLGQKTESESFSNNWNLDQNWKCLFIFIKNIPPVFAEIKGFSRMKYIHQTGCRSYVQHKLVCVCLWASGFSSCGLVWLLWGPRSLLSSEFLLFPPHYFC